MALHRNLLALLVLIALAAAAVVASDGLNQHRHDTSAPIDLVPVAPGASLVERARHDRHRHAYITSVLASRGVGRARSSPSRRRTAEAGASAVSMPLSSGAYTGTGQFFARFLVGTPVQQFLLVADTGSDLTWVKCRGHGNVFRPKNSKSWAPIPCSSSTCKQDVPFSLANCSIHGRTCAYDYKYGESSASAQGVVGTETVTFEVSGGKKQITTLDHVVLGCTISYAGESFQSADGVLSLGNSKISFATGAAERFGGRFSYCLVDHLAPRNVTGYLAFGPGRDETPRPGTPLLLDSATPFYGITVTQIQVAGTALDIPGEVWDVKKNGGVILDSGTTLTVLASPAYKAVVAALSYHLGGVPRVSLDPFEYCYNWTGRYAPLIPKLTVQFAQSSALFEPPAKSYVIDVEPGVKCIGVQEGPWPGASVFGNILQQEHLWEFDLKNQRVSFMQSSCNK